MQNILRLLGVIFADPERSIEDLVAGFEEHNTLFQAVVDPTGILKKNKQRSAAYAAQLVDFNTAIGTGQAGQQVGRTLTKLEQTKAHKRLKSNLASLNSDIVVPDAALRATLIQLLYPHGLDEYTSASFKTLPDQLRVYMDLVQNPDNKVPQVLIDRSQEDLTPFATAREAQVGQKAATKQARSKRRLLLPELEEQLTRNFHGLCVVLEDDRPQVAALYNSQYLGDQAAAHPGRYTNRVEKMHTNQVVNLADAPARYTRLRLSVEEDAALAFYRSADPKGPVPADALRITHDTPLTLPLAELPGTGNWLVVHNAGAYVGHYVAELLAA